MASTKKRRLSSLPMIRRFAPKPSAPSGVPVNACGFWWPLMPAHPAKLAPCSGTKPSIPRTSCAGAVNALRVNWLRSNPSAGLLRRSRCVPRLLNWPASSATTNASRPNSRKQRSSLMCKKSVQRCWGSPCPIRRTTRWPDRRRSGVSPYGRHCGRLSPAGCPAQQLLSIQAACAATDPAPTITASAHRDRGCCDHNAGTQRPLCRLCATPDRRHLAG